MEGLAREAGIAKGTLYAQFADKEAVLGGVVDDLLVELEAAFSEGMAGAGTAAERIGAALAGKYCFILRAVEGSPHANEILSTHHDFAARFATLDRAIEAGVGAALVKAGVADPVFLARPRHRRFGRRRAPPRRCRGRRARDPASLSAA